MRNKKGFSLLEMLAVLVIISLITLIISLAVIEELRKARGSGLLANARLVYTAAHAVILETRTTEEISDEDYMIGLSGTTDDIINPIVTNISNRMKSYLQSDVTLADEPGEENASVTFIIKDKAIIQMNYQKYIDNQHYMVTIENGESTVEMITKEK